MKKTIALAVFAAIIAILAWAPWLSTQQRTFDLAGIGGPSCDYVISHWKPFGREGESCGTKWTMSFLGRVTTP